MTYIATFYSHFGAMRFKKLCGTQGIPAVLMPVPRRLSSSCGTCVRYEGSDMVSESRDNEDIEQIVEVRGDDYAPIYKNT